MTPWSLAAGRHRFLITNRIRSGFSLLEILVAVAIIGILAVMLFPAMSSMNEKGLSAKCVGNLRSVGSAIRVNAADNNGRWVLFEGIFGCWDRTMVDRGYFESTKAFFCPAFKPKKYAMHQAYGATWLGIANAPDNENIIEYEPPSGTRTYYAINLSEISKPAQYLLMADSYTTRFQSQYSIVQGNTALDEIHLRHNHRANVLFADGHVEALGTNGLRGIGWRRAFGMDGKIVAF